MLVIRDVLNCHPGKVGDMVRRFKALSAAMVRMKYRPIRLLTDVSGEPFWTLVAETEFENLAAYHEMESKVMADPDAQQAMSGYHDLLQRGRREIFTLVQ